MKLIRYFSSHSNINSLCLKNLNVRPKTLKLLEEKVGQTQGRHTDKDFVNGPKEVSSHSGNHVNNWQIWSHEINNLWVAKETLDEDTAYRVWENLTNNWYLEYTKIARWGFQKTPEPQKRIGKEKWNADCQEWHDCPNSELRAVVIICSTLTVKILSWNKEGSWITTAS